MQNEKENNLNCMHLRLEGTAPLLSNAKQFRPMSANEEWFLITWIGNAVDCQETDFFAQF